MINQSKKVVYIQVYEDAAQVKSSGFMRTSHNMQIIVRNTIDASLLNCKILSPNNTPDNITRYLLQIKVTRKNFCSLPISISSVSTTKLRIGYMVRFRTYYGVYQYHYINTSKYGV